MYDKRKYDKNAVRKRQMLYAAIKRHMHNLSQYQGYVKSIVKDDKNVLKPKTIFQKNHQDSKWCIQNIINHINCSAEPSHYKFPDNLWVN